YVNPNIFAHEVGHIIGFDHANSIVCQAPDFTLVPYGNRCYFTQYNDPFDAMGFDGFYYHFSSNRKALQGWIPPENVVEVTTPGTYTLVPQEQERRGIQSLKIPIP